MLKIIEDFKIKIFKSKALVFLILVALSLLTASIFKVDKTQANKNKEVLAVVTKAPLVTLTPSPVTIPTSTPILTLAPTPSASPTQTPTPTPATTSLSTPTPTASPIMPTLTPTPSFTPIPTSTPSPAGLNVKIEIDYAGQKSTDSYTTLVVSGQTAWDAVVAAVGISNIQYTDYGGDLGIFITGFNGINTSSNQYFEFRVNGVSSSVGVSAYKCNDGDKLDFVLTTF